MFPELFLFFPMNAVRPTQIILLNMITSLILTGVKNQEIFVMQFFPLSPYILHP
jgi:hypothetical protein